MEGVKIRMSKIEYRSLQLTPVENQKIIEGYAIVFNSPTVLWEDIQTGAKYYEEIDSRALTGVDFSNVIMLYDHGGNVLARVSNDTLELTIDKKGLLIRANLEGTTKGKEAYEEVSGGYITGMSFGFITKSDEFDKLTRTRKVTQIHKLIEVSLCPVPAYQQTIVQARDYYTAQMQIEQRIQQERRRLIVKTKI
jgi:HK97 family phage prohead protease